LCSALRIVAVCHTEDIDPITETGRDDDITATAGVDDAVTAGTFIALVVRRFFIFRISRTCKRG